MGLGALVVAGAGGANYVMAQSSQKPMSSDNMSKIDAMGVDPKNDNIIGDFNAPITVVEYASMTCSHCANFHQLTYPELKKKYIDTGKVRLVFREFPLDRIAFAAAALARCAGEKKFFPFVDMLFRTQDKWVKGPGSPAPRLLSMAKQAGFDEKSFNECMRNKDVSDRIEKVMSTGREKHQVSSTPTLFVNGKKVEGGNSLADLEKAMEPYLKG
jgi:protein-disulfide isomerase